MKRPSTETGKIGRFRRRPRTTTLILLAAVVASWFGLVRLWITHRHLEDRIETQEIRRASDIVGVNTCLHRLNKLKVPDLAPTNARLDEAFRRLDGVCFSLGLVARMATGSEKLAGDMDWCDLPDRLGEAQIWKKTGWDLSSKEAAEIRAKLKRGRVR